jgi:hypothetical protein
MLVHITTLISLSPLSSLSNVVCIHIDQNVTMCSILKQCGNIAYQSNAAEQKQCSISKQCDNVAYQSNAAYQKQCSMSKQYGNVAYQSNATC